MAEYEKPTVKNRLQKEFTIPPFSVLDTTQKKWLERRNEWISKGMKSELGRNENLLSLSDKCITTSSVFDPVLSELMYKWFCPEKGAILDPFAGGSVRGIVAEQLGYRYTGIELRQEQITHNINQATKIGVYPNWICGDSINVDTLVKDKFDFIFSCPPYYNLEVYSDVPGELSNMKTYQEFLTAYYSIISKCMNKLNDNRFACFVVSEIRDKNGFYRNFVAHTIKAFAQCGAKYYNEIILMNSIGSLPIRVKQFFVPNRKIGKRHQNVLVFYKGDVSKIFPIEFQYHIQSMDEWI